MKAHGRRRKDQKQESGGPRPVQALPLLMSPLPTHTPHLKRAPTARATRGGPPGSNLRFEGHFRSFGTVCLTPGTEQVSYQCLQEEGKTTVPIRGRSEPGGEFKVPKASWEFVYLPECSSPHRDPMIMGGNQWVPSLLFTGEVTLGKLNPQCPGFLLYKMQISRGLTARVAGIIRCL